VRRPHLGIGGVSKSSCGSKRVPSREIGGGMPVVQAGKRVVRKYNKPNITVFTTKK